MFFRERIPDSESPGPLVDDVVDDVVSDLVVDDSQAEEGRLVREAQAGSLPAMSRLLDRLAGAVGRICGAIALDDGPDAAQETLVQVFRDLDQLRDPGALRAWVHRIATREAIRHARRGRRERPSPVVGRAGRAGNAGVRGVAIDSSLSEVAGAGVVAVASELECVADVRRVLEQLSPEQRAILVLRDLEGWSEEEAAARLAVAVGTAKSRLHRARRAFRARWRR